MKRRYLYMLLYGVPALLAAIVICTLAFGAVAGALWLFVFGDAAWPAAAGRVLGVLFLLACAAVWIAFMTVAYLAGKRQEAHVDFNTRHIVLSVAVTALLVLMVALHQWSVGNIGTASDGRLCAEFCRGKGFAGSSMPPRDTGAALCSCLDSRGREAVTAPIADITARPGK